MSKNRFVSRTSRRYNTVVIVANAPLLSVCLGVATLRWHNKHVVKLNPYHRIGKVSTKQSANRNNKRISSHIKYWIVFSWLFMFLCSLPSEWIDDVWRIHYYYLRDANTTNTNECDKWKNCGRRIWLRSKSHKLKFDYIVLLTAMCVYEQISLRTTRTVVIVGSEVDEVKWSLAIRTIMTA